MRLIAPAIVAEQHNLACIGVRFAILSKGGPTGLFVFAIETGCLKMKHLASLGGS